LRDLRRVRSGGDVSCGRLTVVERPSSDTGAKAIVVLAYGEQLGKRVALDPRRPMFIGSAAENDLVLLTDLGVAARHARIERLAGVWWIERLDAGATLRVRGRRAQAVTLAHRDEIRLGHVVLVFAAPPDGDVETEYHEQVFRLMTHDHATGTHNLRYFLEAAAHEIARSRRVERPLAVLGIEIDRLRALVHDVDGGLGAELLLERLAERLRPLLRGTDAVLARVAYERFGVLLPDTDLDRAMQIADDLRAHVEARALAIDDELFPATISIGVADLEHAPALEPRALMDAAADALAAAQRAGPNCVRAFFGPN